jgi:3-hydroxymyristoyl/3-hydroxydecanoyl-(acyl carrier protein) dehydratase
MIAHSEVRKLIEHSCHSIDEFNYEFELEVPEDLLYFQGHFHEAPTLPAVFQINTIVLSRIENLWPNLGPLSQISNMKFRTIIGPKDQLKLHLVAKLSHRQVKFRIDRAGETCSQGCLIFGAQK